jgi:hypothetical protein
MDYPSNQASVYMVTLCARDHFLHGDEQPLARRMYMCVWSERFVEGEIVHPSYFNLPIQSQNLRLDEVQLLSCFHDSTLGDMTLTFCVN